MTGKTWLEVALNGGWTQTLQPRIPTGVDQIVAEGIACVRAGAAIVHLHAYNPSTGRQDDDLEIYARIIGGIRAEVDAIVYPTIDAGVPAGSELSVMGPDRYRAVEDLSSRGLLEWSVVDPGTCNISSYAGLARGGKGSVYINVESGIRLGLDLAARYGVHPSYAIYEPGYIRLGSALAKGRPGLKTPIYRLMFSDGFTFGFPPRPYALEAYVHMLAEHAPGAPWMVAGLSADVRPLIPLAVRHGGHVRTGLEDVPLGAKRSNLELVEEAAALIGAAGGTLATAEEIRGALATAGG